MTKPLSDARPDLAQQWHPDRNHGLTPDRVPANSRRRAWWRCPSGHDYETNVAERVNDAHGCPECED